MFMKADSKHTLFSFTVFTLTPTLEQKTGRFENERNEEEKGEWFRMASTSVFLQCHAGLMDVAGHWDAESWRR